MRTRNSGKTTKRSATPPTPNTANAMPVATTRPAWFRRSSIPLPSPSARADSVAVFGSVRRQESQGGKVRGQVSLTRRCGGEHRGQAEAVIGGGYEPAGPCTREFALRREGVEWRRECLVIRDDHDLRGAFGQEPQRLDDRSFHGLLTGSHRCIGGAVLSHDRKHGADRVVHGSAEARRRERFAASEI